MFGRIRMIGSLMYPYPSVVYTYIERLERERHYTHLPRTDEAAEALLLALREAQLLDVHLQDSHDEPEQPDAMISIQRSDPMAHTRAFIYICICPSWTPPNQNPP